MTNFVLKKVSSFWLCAKAWQIVRIGEVIKDRVVEQFLCFVSLVFCAKNGDWS